MRYFPAIAKLTALGLFIILIVSCASGNSNTGSANNQPAQQPDITQPANQNTGGEQNTTLPSSAAPGEQDPEAQAEETVTGNVPQSEPAKTESEEPKAAAKLYRMNDVYRFVPLEGTNAPKKAVLLTFDDGPKEDAMLTAMLDTLDKHNAKAIFFVNGYRAKAKPELLKKIADRGQTIGNHSWDHIDLKKEDETTIKKQIGDVQSFVKQTTGSAPQFFRPPFGSGGDKVKKIARDNGLLYMTWSDGSLDWDASSKDKPEKVIANVLEGLHPGANILMHELPWTKDALDSLLTKLEEKGYSFIDPAAIDLQPKKSGE